MATHRSYSCILIYIFALLISCWISATQSQILATSSSYAASYVYDNKGIIGSFFGSHIHEDTLILSVTNGLVVFDLASRNWLNSTGVSLSSSTNRVATFSTVKPIAPYYDAAWSRIIIASGSTINPKLVALDFDTLTEIPTSDIYPANPKLAPALKGVFGMVADDDYLYYASASSQSNIAQYALRDWTAEPVILNMTSYSLAKSFARDNDTKFLYLGSSDGKLIRVRPNETNFSDSQVDVVSLASEERIATIEVDSRSGYIYATTEGRDRNHTAIVFRVSLETFSVVDQLTLDSFDFIVHTSALISTEQGAILYLGTQQSPTRIIQIDVTRFVRETGYFLPDATSEGADTAVLDVKRNVLWIGTIDPLSVGSTAITIKGAELCLNDCFGRGVCANRTCTCDTAEVDGVILDYMPPWCEFLNCPDPTCGGNGQCANATCVCDAEWTGFNCTIKQCPNNCTSIEQGTCLYENDEPLNCQCKEGWEGEDCSTPYTPISGPTSSESPSAVFIPISDPTSSAGQKIIEISTFVPIIGAILLPSLA